MFNLNLNKVIRSFAISALVWFLKDRYEKSLRLARIQTAYKILSGAEELRNQTRMLMLILIMAVMIGGGAVVLVSGISLLISSSIVFAKNPEVINLVIWVPLGLCLGGLISIIPAFLYIFFVFLSEKRWLAMVKNNVIFGEFIKEVLAEVEKDKR